MAVPFVSGSVLVARLQCLGPGVGHLTEILGRAVQHAGLQMGMCRAPETEVDKRALAAGCQKLLALTQITDPRDMILPCLGERAGP